MTPGLRRFVLAAHITASVGWLGAVIVFLALAIVSLTSQDAQTVRATYLVMAPIGWLVLVPLSLASLLTGLVQALGTTWGLFRHYWIMTKLLINVSAVVLLLEFMRTLSHLADVAATPTISGKDLGHIGAEPMIRSALALLLLLTATVLAVYKPRGMTRYGRRKPRARAMDAPINKLLLPSSTRQRR